MTIAPVPAARSSTARVSAARVSAALWRRAWLRATLTLTPPLAWFFVIYLASLVVMLVTAFWTVNPFTNEIEHTWSLANFQQLFTGTYLSIIARTVGMAALVTVTDAVVALPFAYFMARVASGRAQRLLYSAVLLPLWASYLAKVYSWIVILQKGGTLSWTFAKLGLGSVNIGYTTTAMWVVFSYIWLPFMIIPVYSACERIPASLIEASGDLGARGWRTARAVVLPLVLPGLVAGSIFTFSLTLGDFITPELVGGANSSFIGNVIYSNIGTAGNLPFAATLALVPIVIMICYLLGARLLGAFEELLWPLAWHCGSGSWPCLPSCSCRSRSSRSTPSTHRTCKAGRSTG
jgi:putative spermidine/putrescine transport system permease protein